jgi:nephrocystin-3
MNPQSRTVRVFLSSTFRDFAEERDLLVRKVFPELRRKCRERQVELVDVDLRWGITEEEAQQGKVLPICLAEIDRSRPFFIGLIGERYGWIPEADKYDLSLIMQQPWLEEHRGGKSVTELEILHGVLNNPAMEDRGFFYFRDPEWSQNKGGMYLSEGLLEKEKLEALKDRIRQSGFPVAEDYPTPEALAERIKEDLWKLIDKAFPESEVPDALAQERMRHDAFAASRLGLYIGGNKYFEVLDAVIAGESCQPILVCGSSGVGKSSLLANWAQKFTSAHPEAIVLTHFLGTSTDAAHAVSMAIRILREIARITGEEFVLEGDPRKALRMLEPWLEKAGALAQEKGSLFVLVLDALDKMTDHSDLDWWPRRLPEGVALVASCLDGEIRDAISPKMEWRELRVQPLDRTDCEKFICEHLTKYRKSLMSEQTAAVLEHPLCGNPLFLRTLLEELRVFGVHEELDQRLNHYLSSETVDDLFEKVLDRIESDNTPESVRAALEVLWAAKESFAEDELLTVSGLPPAVWAPIHIALDESLIGAGGRLAFSHDYLRKAVKDRYLSSNEEYQRIQKRMAEFCAEAMADGRKETSNYVRRYAVEHYLEVEDWDKATAALSDLEFIEARAIAQELPEMLHDYALARDIFPKCEHKRQKAAKLRSASDRFTRELIAYSDAWSSLRGGSSKAIPQLPRCTDVAPLMTSEQILAECDRIHDFPNRLDLITAFWKFCSTNIKHLSKNSFKQGYVSNTAYNFSPAGPVHAAGARILQKSEDIKIQRNLDQEYYNPLDPFCGNLEMLQWSQCLAMTPNGKRAVAGDGLHRLWVWDLERRNCIKILGEEKEYLYASGRNHVVAMTPCGSRVVSVGWEQQLKVWDIESGKCIKEIAVGKGIVYSLAITPCGHRVVSCTGCDREEKNYFQVWDIESGCCVKEVFYRQTTYAVAVGPCGTYALVGSCPGFKYVITKINLDLDEDKNECLESMMESALVDKDIKAPAHRGHVRSMAMTPCGTRLISGSEDKNVRVWDLVNGKCLMILEGHESWVKSVAVTPCGKRAISGDRSKTLRIWDLNNGECLRVINVADDIFCLALTACGSMAISGHPRGIQLWDITFSDNINELIDNASDVSHMALSPNSKYVASLQAWNKVKLWNTKNGLCSLLKEFDCLPPFRGFVTSPCGERIIFGGYNRLGSFSLVSNSSISIAELNDDSVMSLNVTPCERFIFTLGLDQKLNIWDAKNFNFLENRTQSVHEVSKLLAISPCGKFIVMGTSIKNSKDKLSLYLWDLESWQLIKVLNGHKDSVNEITFTPCGRFIISASDDNTSRVWDVCSGATIFELKGHNGPCTSIAPTLCGKRVVTGCELEDAIRVWDIDTGKQLSIFKVDRPSKISIRSDTVAIASGHEVFIARHHNLINGPLITTAIKMSSSQDRGSARVNARTPCCAKVISIPEAIADRIEQWTNESGNGGYTDPILLLDCRSCGKPLRMNPFFVDVKPIKK